MPTPRATGLNVIGDLTLDAGVGEAARTTLDAMLRRGIPLSYAELLHNFERRSPDSDPRWLSLSRGSLYPVNLLLYHMKDLRMVTEEQLQAATAGKYTIAYWVWELLGIPLDFLAEFSRVDEVWVPSRFVQEAMLSVARKPVVVVPHAVEVKTSPRIDRGRFGLPENRYVFLFTYSVASSNERKNPWAVIDAFEQAFGHPGDSGPLLVIKTHHLDLLPKVRKPLSDALERVGGMLLEASYSRQQMNDLLACADAYVSLHRSEGFGLGMAESMYLGKPVIATYYSANVDFMSHENSYPVEYQLRPITKEDHRYEPWVAELYQPGQLWAEPDVQRAAWWMRHVFERQDEARERGCRAAADIRRHCSPEVVGRLIEERLVQIDREQHVVRVSERLMPIVKIEDGAMELANRHREALQTWRLIRHISDCIPMAHRRVIGPVAAFIGRIPGVRGVIHGLQRMRYLGMLTEQQQLLNQITFEEMQYISHLLESVVGNVAQLQTQLTEQVQSHGATQQQVVMLQQQMTALQNQVVAIEGRSKDEEARVAMAMFDLQDRLGRTIEETEGRVRADADARINAAMRGVQEQVMALDGRSKDEEARVVTAMFELQDRLGRTLDETETRVRADAETRVVAAMSDQQDRLTRTIEEIEGRVMAEAEAGLERLGSRLDEVDDALRLNNSYLRLLDRRTETDEGARSSRRPVLPLDGSGLAALIRAVEADLPPLAEAMAVGVSIQDSAAEDALLTLAAYFGGRMATTQESVLCNDAWYHIDFTHDWNRPSLFENALHRLRPGGVLVVVTDAKKTETADGGEMIPLLDHVTVAGPNVNARICVWRHPSAVSEHAREEVGASAES